MEALYSAKIRTEFGPKEIAAYCCDILDFEEPIDILTTSAFARSYLPTPRTIFRTLVENGISVSALARDPAIDLRKLCHTWLSKEVEDPRGKIRRIGCVELIGGRKLSYSDSKIEQSTINSIRAYFSMLDIAAIYDTEMSTIALPLLGSGNQHISAELMIVPLLNECIAFLKRNSKVQRICFVERNEEKARLIADYMQRSYNILNQGNAVPTANKGTPTAFISYSSGDKNIADNLCSKLENNGIRVWYAHRDVRGPYAEAITKAIDRCTHFIVILSENSMKSQHVLNEIDLAFQKLPNDIKFKPLRIDSSMFTPSFKYYLSRQHWMDAIDPPLEERLNEFVETLLSDMG